MRWVTSMFAIVMIGAVGLFAHAAGDAAAKPTTKPASGRLFAPYSKMTTLNDDVKTKIRDIHKKALADKRDIEKKEATDIEALLSDDQKKELREIEEKDTATKKKEPAKKDGDGEEKKD